MGLSNIAPGIDFLDTPSHGWIVLDAERNAAIHSALRRANARYEEDLDAFVPALYFRDAFNAPGLYDRAVATLINWRPDEMRKAGFEFEDSASNALRERAAFIGKKGHFIPRSAMGYPHRDTPNGFVLVFAHRSDGIRPAEQGYRDPANVESAWFLVPKAEYNSDMLIDESRHERTDENGTSRQLVASA